MPSINGVDAAHQIQRLNASLPIVIIIGYVDAEQLRNTWQGPVRFGAGRAFLEPPLISDIADVRQHLLAEQFERFHQLAGIFRAPCLE